MHLKKSLVLGLELAYLSGSFFFCRFGLYALHGLRHIPWILYLLGVMALIGALHPHARLTGLFTSVGYMVSCGLAALLRDRAVANADSRIMAIGWCVCYVLLIAAGFVLDRLLFKHDIRG